jgi:hypothetical protein
VANGGCSFWFVWSKFTRFNTPADKIPDNYWLGQDGSRKGKHQPQPDEFDTLVWVFDDDHFLKWITPAQFRIDQIPRNTLRRLHLDNPKIFDVIWKKVRELLYGKASEANSETTRQLTSDPLTTVIDDTLDPPALDELDAACMTKWERTTLKNGATSSFHNHPVELILEITDRLSQVSLLIMQRVCRQFRACLAPDGKSPELKRGLLGRQTFQFAFLLRRDREIILQNKWELLCGKAHVL